MSNKYATLNGKRIVVNDTTTAADLPIQPDDVVMRQQGGTFVAISPTEPIHDKDTLTAVPQVTKGAGRAGPSPWVEQDLTLLRQTLGGRSPVTTKPIERGGAPYLAVEVANVRLNEQKFAGRTFGKLLFLLPQSYPAAPPIGVYVNYPYRMAAPDQHAVGRGYYGAPDLQGAGWYWYCLEPVRQAAWRPSASPAGGHNLVALFAVASHAVNTY